MARLVLLSEGKNNKAIEIENLVSIGRAFDNTLCIDDKKVSRYQAIIERQADGFYLSDLGSINGTTIGDEKIASHRKLKDGEIILVGGVGKIEFHADESATTKPSDTPNPEPPKVDAQAAQASLETTVPAESKQQGASNSGSRSSSMGLKIAFVAVPVLLIAAVGALIFANVGNTNGNRSSFNGQLGNNSISDPLNSNGGGGLNDPNTTNLTPNNNSSTTSNSQTNTNPDLPTSVSLDEIRAMCQQLAVNISGKNDYTFDRDFLILVDRLTRDYLDVRIDERACRYIGVSCNAKNLPVPLGLVLAMQRSKFKTAKTPVSTPDETSATGLLGLPRTIAKGYVTNEEELNNPERATEIGVGYLKDVVDKFMFGKEDFAFAVAYYGADISTIGDATTKLNEGFPDARARHNFWKVINSRQLPLPPKAAENVARFFAAGIVGENPKRFSLSRNPLSQF